MRLEIVTVKTANRFYRTLVMVEIYVGCTNLVNVRKQRKENEK